MRVANTQNNQNPPAQVQVQQQSVGVSQKIVGVSQQNVGVSQKSVGLSQQNVALSQKSVGLSQNVGLSQQNVSQQNVGLSQKSLNLSNNQQIQQALNVVQNSNTTEIKQEQSSKELRPERVLSEQVVIKNETDYTGGYQAFANQLSSHSEAEYQSTYKNYKY